MEQPRIKAASCLCGIILAILLWPYMAAGITGGALDGEGHPQVGTFAWPDGIDEDGDGIADWDTDDDDMPDVPASGGNLTLIHPRVAIGAAHVFQVVLDDLAAGYYTMDDIYVSFSSFPRQHPQTYLGISHVIIHPDYDETFLGGWGAVPRIDVALVILKEPAAGVTPARLAPEGFLDALNASDELRSGANGAPFTIVGYGYHGKSPNQLIPPDGQRRVAISEYMHLNENWLFLDQNEAHGNGGSQIWDSGGPTFWVDPLTGEQTLVALISNGDAVGVSLGLNFRLDTAVVLDFVNEVIDRLDGGEFDGAQETAGNSTAAGQGGATEACAEGGYLAKCPRNTAICCPEGTRCRLYMEDARTGREPILFCEPRPARGSGVIADEAMYTMPDCPEGTVQTKCPNRYAICCPEGSRCHRRKGVRDPREVIYFCDGGGLASSEIGTAESAAGGNFCADFGIGTPCEGVKVNSSCSGAEGDGRCARYGDRRDDGTYNCFCKPKGKPCRHERCR